MPMLGVCPFGLRFETDPILQGGVNMAREGRSAAKIPKGKKTRGIVYASQGHVSHLVKEKSAFARWCEMEELRLASQPAQDFDKAFKRFEQERGRRRSALRTLEHRAEEEKQQRRLPWPGPGQEIGVIEAIKVPFSFSRPTFFSETEILPTKTLIYRGAPATRSDLIYPCPDLRSWSAWFEDDEVTLDQGYRYWFPSTNQHPLHKSFFFSGQFVVDTRLTLQGVVAIGTFGYVTVDAATYVSVVQCTAADKNHDNGWHYDPNYDQLITDWRSYCDGNQQRFFSDTLPGLHTFGHYIDLPVHVICPCGAPNRFAEITHILTITAVNATCQFGPNLQDCASGPASGWIETYWPTISLEYVGPFPWERALRARI